MDAKSTYQPEIAKIWNRIIISRFPEATALPICATESNKHLYGYDIPVQFDKNTHVRLINAARIIDRELTSLCGSDEIMEISLEGKCYDNPARITREIVLHAPDEAISVNMLQRLEECLQARQAAAKARPAASRG